MHVPEDHVLDIGRLDSDLAELGVDGEVGVHALVQHGGHRPPIGLVGNEPVVVSRIEHDVALRVLDQEETDRDQDFLTSRRCARQRRFGDVQVLRREPVQLHSFWRSRVCSCDARPARAHAPIAAFTIRRRTLVMGCALLEFPGSRIWFADIVEVAGLGLREVGSRLPPPNQLRFMTNPALKVNHMAPSRSRSAGFRCICARSGSLVRVRSALRMTAMRFGVALRPVTRCSGTVLTCLRQFDAARAA